MSAASYLVGHRGTSALRAAHGMNLLFLLFQQFQQESVVLVCSDPVVDAVTRGRQRFWWLLVLLTQFYRYLWCDYQITIGSIWSCLAIRRPVVCSRRSWLRSGCCMQIIFYIPKHFGFLLYSGLLRVPLQFVRAVCTTMPPVPQKKVFIGSHDFNRNIPGIQNMSQSWYTISTSTEETKFVFLIILFEQYVTKWRFFCSKNMVSSTISAWDYNNSM